MPNYFNPYMMPQMQQQAQSGLVSVRCEEEARNYPIAPGNSITFKNESAPYVYTKTMGLSPLDRPIFERFRLVKEDAQETQNEPIIPQADNEALTEIKADIEALGARIEALEKTKRTAKKEVVENE